MGKKSNLTSNIESGGPGWIAHFVMGEFGFPNGANYHTHGLPELLGHPDLQICLLIAPKVAYGVFAAAVDRIRDGHKLIAGQFSEGILDGFGVGAVEATESNRKLLRLLLPDPQGTLNAPYYKEQLTMLSPLGRDTVLSLPVLPNSSFTNENAITTYMSLVVRKVPKDWEHPKLETGEFKPMLEEYYLDSLNRWWRWHEQWIEGTHPHQLENAEKTKSCRFYAEWGGDPPSCENYSPFKFSEEEKVCFQIYENVTFGTPLSPVFTSLKQMRNWMIDQGYNPEFAGRFCQIEGDQQVEPVPLESRKDISSINTKGINQVAAA